MDVRGHWSPQRTAWRLLRKCHLNNKTANPQRASPITISLTRISRTTRIPQGHQRSRLSIIDHKFFPLRVEKLYQSGPRIRLLQTAHISFELLEFRVNARAWGIEKPETSTKPTQATTPYLWYQKRHKSTLHTSEQQIALVRNPSFQTQLGIKETKFPLMAETKWKSNW